MNGISISSWSLSFYLSPSDLCCCLICPLVASQRHKSAMPTTHRRIHAHREHREQATHTTRESSYSYFRALLCMHVFSSLPLFLLHPRISLSLPLPLPAKNVCFVNVIYLLPLPSCVSLSLPLLYFCHLYLLGASRSPLHTTTTTSTKPNYFLPTHVRPSVSQPPRDFKSSNQTPKIETNHHKKSLCLTD